MRFKAPVLVLDCESETPEMTVFSVVSGVLARGGGSFLFAQSGIQLTVRLTGFEPALPMPVFWLTQKPAHAIVMAWFRRAL